MLNNNLKILNYNLQVLSNNLKNLTIIKNMLKTSSIWNHISQQQLKINLIGLSKWSIPLVIDHIFNIKFIIYTNIFTIINLIYINSLKLFIHKWVVDKLQFKLKIFLVTNLYFYVTDPKYYIRYLKVFKNKMQNNFYNIIANAYRKMIHIILGKVWMLKNLHTKHREKQ